MQTLEQIYSAIFEHIADPDFVKYIDEPEEIELLDAKDCKLIKNKGENNDCLPSN